MSDYYKGIIVGVASAWIARAAVAILLELTK
jgi:hypothetical protein